jgi:hypothetical protein
LKTQKRQLSEQRGSMTEQQKRSLFFSATGKVATLNPFEYFIFCKGMDAEREACAKLCEEAHWSLDDRNEYAAAIRARGQK